MVVSKFFLDGNIHREEGQQMIVVRERTNGLMKGEIIYEKF